MTLLALAVPLVSVTAWYDARFNRGVEALSEQRCDDARATFGDILAFDSEYFGARYNLGVAELCLDEIESATTRFRHYTRQVADDPDFITNVQTIFNNDIDNSAGLGVGKDMHYTETNEGKLIEAKGVKGRYVRCYSKGNTSNDLNHDIEVAVYGKPVQ